MVNVLLTIVDFLIDSLGGVLTWIFIGILGFFLDLYRRFKQLRDDVDDLDRYLTGDDRDPDSPGLLEKVDKVDTEICELSDQFETHQSETEQKLDRILQENG
jgi:hypothetical protein